ncbi:MAG: Pr6Pr family membrane protein [Pseudonocardia sp.]|nr:Pr6Pr family membrane protein [Pseudonocardia sp.]
MIRTAPLARIWFGAVAAVCLLGIAIQLVFSAGQPSERFPTGLSNALNIFAFFTILTNLLLGLTSLALSAGRPQGLALRVLHLDAVLGIAVTGVVYHLVLAPLDDPRGLAAVANFLLHTAAPVLGVVGWLVVGPRGLTSLRTVLLAAIYPLAWLAVTLGRGAVIDWYPYPFVDVSALGYGRVALDCVVVAVLFLGLGFGALAVDRRLPGGQA